MKTKSIPVLQRLLPTLAVVPCGLLLAACAAAPATPPVQAAPVAVAPAPAKVEPASNDADEGSTLPAQQRNFRRWIKMFRARARARGIAPATLAAAFEGIALEPRILQLDQRQPEFSRRIWSYLDVLVTPARVRNGRAKLARYADIAARAESEYGVPRAIIGAIWGVESSYGDNFGDYDTVAALATLAFKGRRRAWAEKQLYAIFKIIDRGLIEPQALRGSWAGAMGHTQFIPTSYLAYAVDGDGDARIDIWGSIADVMASTANYLAVHGWRRGSPWGVAVKLPANFDYGHAQLSFQRPTQYWAEQGVTRGGGASLPAYGAAAVLAPAGARGPAFLVGPNFKVIMSYNRSVNYALAVGLLADRLAGRPDLQQSWPRHLQPLSRQQVLALQRGLRRRGFDVGTPDGIIGAKTRAGMRAYQRAHGLSADGFATLELLQRVRGLAQQL